MRAASKVVILVSISQYQFLSGYVAPFAGWRGTRQIRQIRQIGHKDFGNYTPSSTQLQVDYRCRARHHKGMGNCSTRRYYRLLQKVKKEWWWGLPFTAIPRRFCGGDWRAFALA
jgi:hypothetical protein